MTLFTFGPFEVLRQLGQGGYSVVYEAYDHEYQRLVALKLMQSNLAITQTMKHRFRREIEAGRRLRHPHIVKVYRGGFHNGQGFISMKLMAGGAVDALCNGQRPVDPTLVARFIRHTARALDYAHSQNVIHRDVKPSNILLDEVGRAYLADFGITKIKGMVTVTLHDDVIGTVHYMAPEQVYGLRYMTRLSDVYSLGATLYHLAAGRVPFDNPVQAALTHAILNAAPPRPAAFNPYIGPHVERVLLRALAKNPRHRFPTAGHLAAAYQEALEKSGIIRKVTPVPKKKPKTGRKRTPPRSPGYKPATQQGAFWTLILALVGIMLLLMMLSN